MAVIKDDMKKIKLDAEDLHSLSVLDDEMISD